MAHFGAFLGTQLDERLVDGFYREALDLTLKTIDRSRKLPPLMPPMQHPLPPPPQSHQFVPQPHQFMPPHDMNTQFQPYPQPQPPQPTFHSMLGPFQPPPGPSTINASSSTWGTFMTAGLNTVQPVVPARHESTPNMSLTSLPRLSDISQSLMTSGDPSDHPKSPGAINPAIVAIGGFFLPCWVRGEPCWVRDDPCSSVLGLA